MQIEDLDHAACCESLACALKVCNGAVMRVSSIAYLYGTLEDVECFAAVSAMPTHDHPDGIRGAKAIAGAIFMALEGKSKDEIERYISAGGYEIAPSVEYLREHHTFDVRCTPTVEAAVRCFLDADSFESCLSNCVWIGGDDDTNAATAGGIAEAMWGIQHDIREVAYFTIEQDWTDGLLPEVISRCDALKYIRAIRRYQLPPEDTYDKRKLIGR